MWLRANVVLAVAVVFAVIQMFASVTGGPRVGDVVAGSGLPDRGLSRSVAAQEEDNDDEDEDNEEDDDEDNDDEDDADNEDDADDDNGG